MKTSNIVLFKYFNSKGACLHEIAMADDGALERPGSSGTSRKEAAFGLQALIAEVTSEAFSIHTARDVRSLSVDGGAQIALGDALDELETNFGTSSVQWARAIFKHLKMAPPTVQ